MVWGRSRSLGLGVHYFDEQGESLCCGARNGKKLKLRWSRPDWDPGKPGEAPTRNTCPACKILYEDEMRMQTPSESH